MENQKIDSYQDGDRYRQPIIIGAKEAASGPDWALHKTLETFVTEKTAERAIHAKGYGAGGYFRAYQSMELQTELCFLQRPGQKTPVSARFSLAAGSRGAADTSRNVRGFAVKFFTDEGVFDLLCNHIPVSPVRDAIRFPEAMRALAPSPVNNLEEPGRFWNFAADAPEATHFILRLYSDEGTVKSFRHLKTHSVNTYIWKNKRGERKYVKYHWLPMAGVQCIDRREARQLAGDNPDCAGYDLYRAIAGGVPVQYELCVQLMEPEEARGLSYDPLDATKVWSAERYPLLPVGQLTLNTNPGNYIEQVEKLAFSPANLLKGAELSADRMLQGRAFIYGEAQRYRLGKDFRSLPANAWPEGGGGKGPDCPDPGAAQKCAAALQTNDFTQAGEYYRSLSAVQKDHLAVNLGEDMINAQPPVRQCVLGYFEQTSPELAAAVRERICQAARRYS